MKKILLALFTGILFLGVFQEAKASHAAGGEITYRYIGDSTGIPYNYCITLSVYRRNESGSATLGASQTITINSSCFSSQSVTLTREVPPPSRSAGDGGWKPLEYASCIDENDPSFFQISQHIYKACIVLPGKCVDFRFSWSLCCRNANITNLQNPSSASLYLQSTLNNLRRPNTSASFLNPAAKSFCVNRPFTWSQAATEPDKDSIRYTLQQPWTAYNSPINYSTGFGVQNPMKTTGGFNLDPRTGVFNFTPSQSDVDVIKIVVEEYSYDSLGGFYALIGTAIRELQLPILATCNIIAQKGITIDTNITGPTGVSIGSSKFSTDSLRDVYRVSAIGNDSTSGPGGAYFVNLPAVPYNCYDSIVSIKFSTKLKCSTFSTDGSEFRLIGPDQKPRPVIGVNTKCGTDFLTSEVDLMLHKPLDTNGNYLLYIKTGNDGDVLENECGFAIKPFFGIIIKVQNCDTLNYHIANVTVDYDKVVRIDWEAVDSTYSKKLFVAWNILRAGSDDIFYKMGEVNDEQARSYVDTLIDPLALDYDSYQYAIQLVQNYDFKKPTKSVRTILLETALLSDSSGIDVSWNEYNGWDSASYEVEIAKFDSITGAKWVNFDGPRTGGFLQTNYAYPDPMTSDTAGLYAFRVKATEPHNPNNTYISESNWIYFELIYPDPEKPDQPVISYVPNVFTPDGDGVNDLFYLNTNGYSTVSISVYNRWGKLVYEDINASKEDYYNGGKGWDGTDINSGQKLADGTYYYILDLKDEPTGKSEQLKGHLNIFGGGTR